MVALPQREKVLVLLPAVVPSMEHSGIRNDKFSKQLDKVREDSIWKLLNTHWNPSRSSVQTTYLLPVNAVGDIECGKYEVIPKKNGGKEKLTLFEVRNSQWAILSFSFLGILKYSKLLVSFHALLDKLMLNQKYQMDRSFHSNNWKIVHRST